MSRPVVIIMVKAPRAGLVKTRLTPPLIAEDAASLAACFAQDTVANARRVVRDLIIAYTPSADRAILEALLPRGLLWVEQQGEDLGERLERVARHASRSQFNPILIMGADSPTLPASFIERACEALVNGDADVTLGPTADGGYYLVGLRGEYRNLFRNVAWSTPLAYEQTADNALRLGLRLLKLPPWYDVDTPLDLLRLRDEIFKDEEARSYTAATYGWLLAHQSILRQP
jgi:rSAM/selenodomain-associated transferase 1